MILYNLDFNSFFSFPDNPLTCGCDMAWIFTDSNYFDAIQIGGTPTCDDGTPISDIDGDALVSFCLWAENEI